MQGAVSHGIHEKTGAGWAGLYLEGNTPARETCFSKPVRPPNVFLFHWQRSKFHHHPSLRRSRPTGFRGLSVLKDISPIISRPDSMSQRGLDEGDPFLITYTN